MFNIPYCKLPRVCLSQTGRLYYYKIIFLSNQSSKKLKAASIEPPYAFYLNILIYLNAFNQLWSAVFSLQFFIAA